MAGIILLVISLLLFFCGKLKYSLLLFAFMAMRYMNLIPMSVMAINGQDLAIVFMIIASFTLKDVPSDYYINQKLDNAVKAFFIFMTFAPLVSMLYHGMSFFQTFMGCRAYYLFLSYFFLRKIPVSDILWVIKALFVITCIHSALYIIQCSTGLPVLGVSVGSWDRVTHTLRYNNFPPLNNFYLMLTLFFPSMFKWKYTKYLSIVFFFSLFFTMSRLLMAMVILFCFVGLYIKGSGRRLLAAGVVISIISIPLGDAVLARYTNKGETSSDIESVLNGDFITWAETGANPSGNINKTLTYRFAWTYERMDKMVEQSIITTIFGLGYFPPSSPIGAQIYHFKTGMKNEMGFIEPCFTPDISYGDIFANYGLIGGFLFLLIWFRLFEITFRNKDNNPIIFTTSIFVLSLFFTGLTSTTLFLQGSLFIPFIVSNLALMPEEEVESTEIP